MERKEKGKEQSRTEESFYACSAQDCTGLIPSLPQDGAELEAYEELYPFLKKTEKEQ